ncbi:tripartite tricarboxylate transporter TctB family protein [Abyssibius alkaniclasticus]|uniref:tripartite tricarboxylate transporter TctB family protein n=1 Tax=Abyssibius alkaniclasticus TaxID=2881234 RepID=UPI002363DE54|nr:tripartite tricarboxylate transporter TctB family protein [Abyssibius alkaniclasticus]UPH69815.1 tripartite tricarboxylate transporter TctB family protein [Abyssibius alkaniclasticus]|tara:strand:- start:273 stop:716 length:444 start_codon:yes stop_codon:yes gene_type:complete
MMKSDRILGLVAIVVALAFFASALQIQTSFLADPLGSKPFPIAISVVTLMCGLVMVFRPEPDPEWPSLRTFGALAIALVVLVGYAYSLKPFGFILPTVIASAVLSYQISPRPLPAVLTGLGLGGGLYVIFKYVLKLGLVGWPPTLFG